MARRSSQAIFSAVLFVALATWTGHSHASSSRAPEKGTAEFAAEEIALGLDYVIGLPVAQCAGRFPEGIGPPGLDFRACWGDIVDDQDRPVCGAAVMKELRVDLQNFEPIFDTTGKGGSTLVTNTRSFIIKAAKDDEEYDMMRTVMDRIYKSIRRRSGQWSTALTPICLVLKDSNDVAWMLMRKVEILGERTSVHVEGNEVFWFDLKGPEFTGIKDGKSYMDRRMNKDVWTHKDAGFSVAFPDGLELSPCGSRSGAITIMRDSILLAELGMTDYSLMGVLYESSSDEGVCNEMGKPRFPIVFDVKRDESNGNLYRPLRFALGIIDYMEFRSWWWWWLKPMSTVKRPVQYARWWLRMWPEYFQLPRRELIADGLERAKVIGDIRDGGNEEFHVGQPIMAIQKVKWTSEEAHVARCYNGAPNQKCRWQQTRMSSKWHPTTISRVYAGSRGEVVGFGLPGEDARFGLLVRWISTERGSTVDDRTWYYLWPEQVVGTTRSQYDISDVQRDHLFAVESSSRTAMMTMTSMALLLAVLMGLLAGGRTQFAAFDVLREASTACEEPLVAA